MEDHAGRYRLSPEERRRTDSFLKESRIPPVLERAIEDYIVKKTGKPLNDPVVLERLRRAVVAQKSDYWKSPTKRRLSYTKGYSVLGYLAYHFPVYFMQTEYILRDLAAAGLLRPAISILDIGTGPGVVPLAIADFYGRLDDGSATVWSIEQSEEHIEAFRFLREAAYPVRGKTALTNPIPADIRTVDDQKIPGPVDLLIFSNVVNELETRSVGAQADLVMRFAGHLAPAGTILIVEPAEEGTATRLRVLSQVLQDRGLSVHSPCSFLWGTRCDPSRCWSFTTQPDIYPTRMMEVLAACDEPYRYRNTDIKYAYVILRKDTPPHRDPSLPSSSKVARLSKLHLHVNRQINIVAAKMSQDLGDRKNHVFKVCDGTAGKPVYAVLPEYQRNPANDILLKAPYGEVLELRQVIVRYNRKHDAYNLHAGKNTRVFRIGD